jgi:alpha-L-fucosidase 2
METLKFDNPAQEWNQALPIGNGRMGAMVFGGINKERIALNQDSIWYGGPIDRVNKNAKDNLEEVRQLILNGQIPEAEQLLRYAFSGTPQSERPYQPLGNIHLTYHNTENNCEITEYNRELDIENSIVKEHFSLDDNRIYKEYIASCPHGIIAVHMKALDSTLSMDLMMERGRFYDHVGKMDESTIYMDGTLGSGGVSFLVAIRAQALAGKVSVIGEHLIIRDAKEVTLYISCETSFYEKNWKQKVIERLTQACKDGYNYIKEKHFEDYKNLFDRVKLSIDNSFAPLYFQYGRYLLISSSRKGSLPANLQGIWNEDMQPAWDSKFTININTEMNYWLAETCSLPECHLPLFEHLKRMWKNGKYVADKMYGCRGFVAHHNTDLWGDCAPQDIYIPATYWVMGGAWLCTHIWNHYSYTNDKNFLQEMYPILKDAVLFFHDYLIEVNGELVTCPSVSPENTYIMPSGVKGCICYGSSMDIQILRDLFDGYLKASKELDICDEIVEKTKKIINKLPKINIGKYGQIMEWQEDYDEAEPGHRHISQLYALHPSHQITIEETPKLAEAAAKTLERRLSYGGGHTGWSRAWIVNLYARLHDGENALKNLNELWDKSTFENLMDNHPFRGGYVFQIDGNFGATAAIAEMLVQSYEDKVVILPALPKQWKNGKVTGLTICGGAKIDIEWKNGELLTYSIYSDRDMVLSIIYKDQEKRQFMSSKQQITSK